MGVALYSYPKEVPILEQHIISCQFFWAQYPEMYHKSSWCGLFKAELSKRFQNRFLTPKRYDEQPCSFYTGPPTPWVVSGILTWHIPFQYVWSIGSLKPSALSFCFKLLGRFYSVSLRCTLTWPWFCNVLQFNKKENVFVRTRCAGQYSPVRPLVSP